MEEAIVLGRTDERAADLLTNEALRFVGELARHFAAERELLLDARKRRQEQIREGKLPDFPVETRAIREGSWRAAEVPPELQDRRVEITGPASDRKMVINALNSGAKVYMLDFEDANAPGWHSVINGHINLRDAVRRTITFRSPDGMEYKLGSDIAKLCIRPRGLHLTERHILVDARPVSASLFDFGLSIFHCGRPLLEQGVHPHYYLPKLESYLEARFWDKVCAYAESRLSLPRGSIKLTVLIEHILAAFQMDEIVFELKDRITGLNFGRWDYIFSIIKTFGFRSDFILPDRIQLTMERPFLRSAAEMLVRVCHRRGIHAIGGMSAYIPRRDDPERNAQALQSVQSDKEREAKQGYDGAWVAHPDLVPIVLQVFEKAFHGPNQLHVLPEVSVTSQDLLTVPRDGAITEGGIRSNISVALQYLDSWICGRGAAAIFGLMEDTATAEIARAQVWQWLFHGVALSDSRIRFTPELYFCLREEELRRLLGRPALDKAAELLDRLILSREFIEFLTIPGYSYLD